MKTAGNVSRTATGEATGAQARAVARYARVTPDKARQVVAHIRGRRIDDARRILQLSPKGAAEQIRKTLDSAVANAEHNQGLDPDELVVVVATVDEGPTLRRFRPRAMGRAYRIRKRTSHITIAVGRSPQPGSLARRGRSGTGGSRGQKE